MTLYTRTDEPSRLPEYGEYDSQPDGDGVYEDAETGVEQHEAGGRVAVPLGRQLRPVQHVEVHRERQIGGHRQPVGDSQPGQDAVRRRDHVASRQHDDVESVGDDAEDADGDGKVAVIRSIPVAELGQLTRAGEPILRICRHGDVNDIIRVLLGGR